MSTTFDERVVGMRFDNQQFEEGARQSISTLEKLKNALNMNDSTKSLNNISDSARKVSFDGLYSGIDEVGHRFRITDTIVDQTFRRITNAAIDTGHKVVNAFAIAPISDGMKEYELKMGSVQTIMNSTGESIENINKTLDELNTYADKTIYSFSDMTTSIGKFTNNGVSLKNASAAIQGISNAAAYAGSNAQQASSAMYNFSQALSAGSLKLIDWKSIEMAGMANPKFKENLIATAKEMKTVKDLGNGMYESITTNLNGKVSDAFNAKTGFNNSLNAGWITTDVLLKTLQMYSDETTELGRKATAAATEVKTFSQLIDTLKEAVGSGWAETWQLLIGDYEEAKKLWTAVNNVLSNFVDTMSDARNETLKFWKENGGREAILNSFSNIFKGLMNIIRPISKAFNDVFGKKSADEKGASLVALSKRIEDLSRKFLDITVHSEKFYEIFSFIFGIAKKAIDVMKIAVKYTYSFAKVLKDNLLVIYDNFKNKSSKGSIFSSIFGDFDISYFKDKIVSLKNGIIDFVKSFSGSEKSIKDTAKAIKDNIVSAFGEIDIAKVLDTLFAAFAVGATFKFMRVSSPIFDIFDGFGDVLDGISRSVNASALLEVAKAIAILAGSVLLMSLIPSDKLLVSVVSLGALAFILSKLSSSMVKSADGIKGFGAIIKMSIMLIALASSIFIVAEAFKTISSIEGGLMQGIIGLGAIVAALVGSCLIINRFSKDVKKSTFSFVQYAVSVFIMAKALDAMKSLNAEDALKGVLAIAAMAITMAAALKIVGKTKTSGGAFIALSLSILIVYAAVKKLGEMKTTNLEKGLLSVVAIIGMMTAAISIASALSKGAFQMAAIGMAFIAMAFAIDILIPALYSLGNMSIKQIATSLGVLAGTFIILGVAATLLAPLVPVILSLSAAVLGFGIGIAAISVGIAALSVFLSTLGGSIALFATELVATVGIIIAGFDGMIIEIAGAVYLLISSLISMVVRLAPKFGDGVGTIILAILKGLNKYGPQIFNEVFKLLLNIIDCIEKAMQVLFERIPNWINTLADTIRNNAEPILVAVANLFSSIAELLILALADLASGIPGVGDKISEWLHGVRDAMAKTFDEYEFNKLGKKAADDVNEGLHTGSGGSFDIGKEIADSFSSGVETVDGPIKLAGSDAIESFAAGIKDKYPNVNSLGSDMANTFSSSFDILPADMGDIGTDSISQFTSSFSNGSDNAVGAAQDLFDQMTSAMGKVEKDSEKSGKQSADNYSNKIRGEKDTAKKSAKEVSNNALDGFNAYLSNIKQAGANAGQGYVDGIKASKKNAKEAAMELANASTSSMRSALDEHSPSKITTKIGAFAGIGYGNGALSTISFVKKSFTKLAKSSLDFMNDTLNRISETMSNEEPEMVITPVVDLAEVRSGLSQMNSMFSNQRASAKVFNGPIGLSSYDAASNIASGIQNGVNANAMIAAAVEDFKNSMLESYIPSVNNYYNVDGITYDDGSNISEAVGTLIRATIVERRK